MVGTNQAKMDFLLYGALLVGGALVLYYIITSVLGRQPQTGYVSGVGIQQSPSTSFTIPQPSAPAVNINIINEEVWDIKRGKDNRVSQIVVHRDVTQSAKQ